MLMQLSNTVLEMLSYYSYIKEIRNTANLVPQLSI